MLSIAFLSLALLLAACGGGGSSVGGSSADADLYPPLFSGLKSAVTGGGTFGRLAWNEAVDNQTPAMDLRYRVYGAATSGAQDFDDPILTTPAGATSVILDAGDTSLLAIGTEAFFVVRAVDGDGHEDENTVELAIRPVAASAVAFVSDTAAGAGALGDPTNPFPTLQAGVDAVESGGGGVVLVDAAPGGTTYAEEVDLTASVASIGLFGSFARFDSLAAAPAGDAVLALRDGAGHATTLTLEGLAPLADDDLLRIENGGASTYVDGFDVMGLPPALMPLTGTLTFHPGDSWVSGTGTLFASEVSEGDSILLDADGVPALVGYVNNNTNLYLDDNYVGAGGTGTASVLTPGDPDQVAVRALDAHLQLSYLRMEESAAFRARTTGIAARQRLTLVGNEAHDYAPLRFLVEGAATRLRFQNNRVDGSGRVLATVFPEDDEEFLRLPGILLPGEGRLAVPSGGLDVVISHNLLSNNREGRSGPMVRLDFAPADPMVGGDLTVLAEHNEIRDHWDEALYFYEIGNVGVDGSAEIVVRENLLNGAGSSQVEIRTQPEGGSFPGVAIDIEIHDNQLLNGNSIPCDVDLDVVADRTTTLSIRDNLLMIGESEAIEVRDGDSSAPGASDRGIILMECLRNVALGGVEDIEFEVGVAHGGRTQLDIVENTILSSEDEGFNLDIEDYLGDAGTSFAYPDGVYVFNVFNNDVEAHDDEAFEIRDERDADSRTAVIAYVGHTFAHNGSDPSDGAIRLEHRGPHAAWLVERCFTGLGGADGGETGIDLESERQDIPCEVRLLNNVATLASGGGFSWQGSGGAPQLVNCTAAYAGQEGEFGFEASFNSGEEGSGGHSQALVLNCLSSHSGGGDMDWVMGVRPAYTLIRDTPSPAGLGNIGTEPFFEKDVSDIVYPEMHSLYGDMFTLQSGSPAVDAGHPAAAYNDPDGSRNDMGAYGGPNAGRTGFTEPGTEQPFVYVGTFPAVQLYTGAPLVDDDETIHLGFTRPVDASTLAAGLFVTSGGISVPVIVDTIGGGHLVRIRPDPDLTPGASDIVEIRLTTALEDEEGMALAYPVTFRFGVRPDIPVLRVDAATAGEAGPQQNGFPPALDLDLGGAPAAFEVESMLDETTTIETYELDVQVGDRLMATVLDARRGGGEVGAVRLDLYNAGGEPITMGRFGQFGADDASFGDPYVDHIFWFAGTYTLVVTTDVSLAGESIDYTLQGVLDRED